MRFAFIIGECLEEDECHVVGPSDRRMDAMGSRQHQSGLVAAAGFLGFLVAAVYAVQVLPGEVSSFLMAWIMSSFPIGILIGHCALSED